MTNIERLHELSEKPFDNYAHELRLHDVHPEVHASAIIAADILAFCIKTESWMQILDAELANRRIQSHYAEMPSARLRMCQRMAQIYLEGITTPRNTLEGLMTQLGEVPNDL